MCSEPASSSLREAGEVISGRGSLRVGVITLIKAYVGWAAPLTRSIHELTSLARTPEATLATTSMFNIVVMEVN